jgi:hypothetical protein
MTKKNQNFSMVAGDTMLINIGVTDSNGTPINLTGCSITWIVKKTVKAPIVLVTKTTQDDIAIRDVRKGLFVVKLNSQDTAGFDGRMYHEAKVKDAFGDVATVATGLITFVPSGAVAT